MNGAAAFQLDRKLLGTGDFSTPLRFVRNDGSGMGPLRAASAENFLH